MRMEGEIGDDVHSTFETQPLSARRGMGPTRGSVPKEMIREDDRRLPCAGSVPPRLRKRLSWVKTTEGKANTISTINK